MEKKQTALITCNFFQEESCAWITLSVPEKRNALSSGVMEELRETLNTLQKHPHVRVVVLSGDDRAFAAGVDLTEVACMTPEKALNTFYLGDSWRSLTHFPLPTIAAVSGYALGGGFELALMCDLIVATETARFGFPEVTLGLLPGLGGTQKLTRLIGPYRAAELCFTGHFLTAKEAAALGVLTQVASEKDLKEVVLSLAQKISQQPKTSLQLIKKAIACSQEAPLSVGLDFERQLFFTALATSEKEKRTKRFYND
ncbi:MAG: enoyl-CoA hydratase/isomerase family protein [Holosporales bacterium]|jgi:enoyl-CoA hydratase|nr:enoyl-CoA hydratase/isomerase family protein [Holosporales bacterium]